METGNPIDHVSDENLEIANEEENGGNHDENVSAEQDESNGDGENESESGEE